MNYIDIGKNITLAWILLAATGVLVAASTKSLFVPSLVISDVANDEDRWVLLPRTPIGLIGFQDQVLLSSRSCMSPRSGIGV
jgi:hypothetical protein